MADDASVQKSPARFAPKSRTKRRICALTMAAFLVALVAAWIVLTLSDPLRSWDVIAEFEFMGRVPVTQYRHKYNGMRMTFVVQNTTSIHGKICLPTLPEDEDGLPFCTQGMVMQGSKRYPHPAVMGLLGDISLSLDSFRRGAATHTWQDMTCFSYTYLNQPGHLKMTRVLLDYILEPDMSQRDFVHWVHHVDGQGRDGGIAYKARENPNPRDILEMELRKLLYPPGQENSTDGGGYGYDRRGTAENIRSFTTLERIKAYHRKFYLPGRLYLVAFGPLDHGRLAGTVEGALGELNGSFLWSKPPRLELPSYPQRGSRVLEKDVDYPSSSASARADLGLGWRMEGKYRLDGRRDASRFHELVWLVTFLADKAVLEAEDLYQTDVSVKLFEFPQPSVALTLSGLDSGDVNKAEDAIRELLRRVADGEEPLDLETFRVWMKKFLDQVDYSRLHVSELPSFLHDAVFNANPDDGGDLSDFLNADNGIGTSLLEQDSDFWRELLRDLLASPSVTVRIFPSRELKESLDVSEEKRLLNRRVAIGPDGLAAAAEMLERVREERERHVPDGVLETDLASVDADEIAYPELRTYNWSTEEQPNGFVDVSSLPYRFHLIDLPAKENLFLMVAFDYTDLPAAHWQNVDMLYPVWLPRDGMIGRGDKASDFFDHWTCNNYIPGILNFEFHAQGENYKWAVRAATRLVLGARPENDLDRVRDKLRDDAEIRKSRRERVHPYDVGTLLARRLSINGSYPNWHDIDYLRLGEIDKERLEAFETPAGWAKTAASLKETLRLVLRPERAAVFLVADVDGLKEKFNDGAVGQVLKNFLGGEDSSLSPRPWPAVSTHRYLKATPPMQLRHLASPAPDSSVKKTCSLFHLIPVPEVTDPGHPDFPALTLALHHLKRTMDDLLEREGFDSWKCNFQVNDDGLGQGHGHVTVSISPCDRLYLRRAFHIYQSLAANLTSGSASSWRSLYLQASKGNKISSYIRKSIVGDPNSSYTARSLVLPTLKQRSDAFLWRRLVRRLAGLTVSDVAAAARRHLSLLSRPADSVLTASCTGAEMTREMAREFAASAVGVGPGHNIDFTVVEDIPTFFEEHEKLFS